MVWSASCLRISISPRAARIWKLPKRVNDGETRQTIAPGSYAALVEAEKAFTAGKLDEALAAGRRILLEGQLGTLPDLPAVQDSIAGFEGYEWNGVFVPANTSPEIVTKLNAGLNEVLRQPDIQARLKTLNIDYRENTPDDFKSFVVTETEKWGKVVKDAGIKLG